MSEPFPDPPVPALSAKALTSYETAIAYIGLRDVDDEEIAELVALVIDGFSEAIHGYCDREFVMDEGTTEEGTRTRTFEVGKGGIVSFEKYDLRDLEAISHDGVELDLAASYSHRLYPLNKTNEDTYLWMRTGYGNTWARWPVGYEGHGAWKGTIDVTGWWGMAVIPRAVELALLVSIKNLWTASAGFSNARRGAQEFSAVVETEAESGGFSLPPSARRLLAPFRRSNWGK